jgi:hypothetical protein
VLAYALRDHSDGSYSIDVWDNNHHDETYSIEVAANGDWSYEPLDWEASPKDADGAYSGLLAAVPLFEPHHLHLTTPPADDRDELATVVDVPVDTTVGAAMATGGGRTLIVPNATDLHEYAGVSVLFTTTGGSMTLAGDAPNAMLRGDGLVASVKRLSGDRPIDVIFDSASGTIGTTGAPVQLTVTRNGVRHTATDAEQLTVAPDGTVTTVPSNASGNPTPTATPTPVVTTTPTPVPTVLPQPKPSPSPTPVPRAKPSVSVASTRVKRSKKLMIAVRNVAAKSRMTVTWTASKPRSAAARRAAKRASRVVVVAGASVGVGVPKLKGRYVLVVKVDGASTLRKTITIL